MAVRAFNIEVAAIKSLVSRQDIGEMRIGWWRNCLDALYADADAAIPNNPIALALREAIATHRLTKAFFTKIVVARVRLRQCPSASTPLIGIAQGLASEAAADFARNGGLCGGNIIVAAVSDT